MASDTGQARNPASARLTPAAGHDPIAALRLVCAELLERADPASAIVANAIATWLAVDVGWDAALGLATNWRSTARLRARDTALRALAAEYFPNLVGRRLAVAVAHAVRRYECGGWARDRATRHRPDKMAGAIYDVLSVGAVPAERQLRNILGNLGCVAISKSAA